jgi:hypothetical protein
MKLKSLNAKDFIRKSPIYQTKKIHIFSEKIAEKQHVDGDAPACKEPSVMHVYAPEDQSLSVSTINKERRHCKKSRMFLSVMPAKTEMHFFQLV